MTIKVLGGELHNMFRAPKLKVTKEQILVLPTFKCPPTYQPYIYSEII
jgi:hypothetical protein